MTNYDYKEGSKRIIDIFEATNNIKEIDKLPNDEEFEFENVYESWITCIYINIKNLEEIYADIDIVAKSKLLRSFTSEVIGILKEDDDFLKEISNENNYVYAIYSSPKKKDTYYLANKTFIINTFVKMFNKLLKRYCLPKLKVGISMVTSKDFIARATREDLELKNKIWMGDTVSLARNLDKISNCEGNKSIVFSESAYFNFIDLLEKANKDKAPREWFIYNYSEEIGTYYVADIVKTNFNNWIKHEL